MNPLILLDWRLWAAVAAAAALAASHWKVFSLGKAEIRADWMAERAEMNKQSLRIVEKTIKDTADLQAQTEQTNGEKNEQIASITARAADLDRRLRNRSPRPEGGTVVPTSPADGASAPGCTGERLPREDGQFLNGDAADAAILQAGLKACYQQYESVRTKINALEIRGLDQ